MSKSQIIWLINSSLEGPFIKSMSNHLDQVYFLIEEMPWKRVKREKHLGLYYPTCKKITIQTQIHQKHFPDNFCFLSIQKCWRQWWTVIWETNRNYCWQGEYNNVIVCDLKKKKVRKKKRKLAQPIIK